MFAEIVSLVAAGLLATAYFERKSLKADAVAAEAEVVAAGLKFLTQLRTKESQVRAKIYADITKALVAAKADAEKIEELVKSGDALVDGRVKGLVSDIEAALKKAI
jgi:hypothetical protein